MPKITQLRTFDGALWAKLEIDVTPTIDGSVHVFTDKEIRKLKDDERKAVWNEIQSAVNLWGDE